MWIIWLLGKGVMNPVSNNPVDWTALKREHSTKRQNVFNPLWRLEPAMRKQTMKTYAYTKTARYPEHYYRHDQRFPRKEEQSRNRTQMDNCQRRKSGPIDLIRSRFRSFLHCFSTKF